jgi:hypothetical protein
MQSNGKYMERGLMPICMQQRAASPLASGAKQPLSFCIAEHRQCDPFQNGLDHELGDTNPRSGIYSTVHQHYVLQRTDSLWSAAVPFTPHLK